MSQIKNAQIRYRIIDRSIRNNFKPYPSKQDLREACEEALYGSVDGQNICDSTIEKDLFAMRMDHDAPIKYSKVNRGYYYTDENYSIDNIPLTSEDLQAIQFATKTLMQFRDVEMFKQFGNAIDKIVDRVNVASNKHDGDSDEVVQFESGLQATGNEHLSLFLDAIHERLLVVFDYASFVTGKKKARTVLPLLLKEYRNRWYLISEDQDKRKIITYALERMDEVRKTDRVGLIPTDFNPKHFFQNAIGITTYDGPPEKVVFKTDAISAKYIESQPFHHTQKKIKKGKKKITFSLNVIVTEELIREILSYGGNIEVILPSSLREKITDRVVDMAKNYNL